MSSHDRLPVLFCGLPSESSWLFTRRFLLVPLLDGWEPFSVVFSLQMRNSRGGEKRVTCSRPAADVQKNRVSHPGSTATVGPLGSKGLSHIHPRRPLPFSFFDRHVSPHQVQWLECDLPLHPTVVPGIRMLGTQYQVLLEEA